MKILYLNYVASAPGPILRTRNVAAGLATLGHDVVLRFLNPGFSDPRKRAGRAALQGRERRGINWPLPIRWVRYLAGFLLQNVFYVFEETRLLRQERPDVVIARVTDNFSIFLSTRLVAAPLVIDTDAPFAELRLFGKRFFGQGLYEWLEKTFLKKAGAITVISSEVKRHYAQLGVPGDNMFVAPNAADPEAYDVRAGRVVRHKLGLGRETLIGFVGNLAPWHGLKTLLDAYLSLKETERNIILLLVGTDLTADRLKESFGIRCVDYDIIPTGFIEPDALTSHIAAMDIVCVPYEPMDFFYFSPMKLFEGMAAGKTVVAASLGQITEVVQDGVDGLLYPPGDVARLREILLKLLQEPASIAEYGERAAAKIRDRYTWGHTAKAYESACFHALGKPSPETRQAFSV